MSTHLTGEETLENVINLSYENHDQYEQIMSTLEVDHAAPAKSRGMLGSQSLELDFNAITQFRLPDHEYNKEESKKTQIYIHHTASWGSGAGAIAWWKQDKNKNGTTRKVGTFMCISGYKNHPSHKHTDGELVQAFSSKHWAYHLGVKSSNSKALNRESIGIELANWGQLKPLRDGTFVPAGFYKADEASIDSKFKITEDKVVEYPEEILGFRYYERYTKAQILSLKKLLLYLCKSYHIPKTYHSDMWSFSQKALNGEPGIWTHVSVRTKGKWDCHPQPELIDMLKSLEGTTA